MKLVFFSDVHGNEVAVRRFIDALIDIEYDLAVCLGDVTGIVGHEKQSPDTCAHLVRTISDLIVYGNHDARWRSDHPFSAADYEPGGPTELQVISDAYTEQTREWIDRLPERIEFTEGGRDIVIAHADPFAADRNHCGYPANNYRPAGKETKFFKEADNELVVIGHTHKAHFAHFGKFSGQTEGNCVLNPGSLGYDGDFAVYDTESPLTAQFYTIDATI